MPASTSMKRDMWRDPSSVPAGPRTCRQRPRRLASRRVATWTGWSTRGRRRAQWRHCAGVAGLHVGRNIGSGAFIANPELSPISPPAMPAGRDGQGRTSTMRRRGHINPPRSRVASKLLDAAVMRRSSDRRHSGKTPPRVPAGRPGTCGSSTWALAGFAGQRRKDRVGSLPDDPDFANIGNLTP